MQLVGVAAAIVPPLGDEQSGLGWLALAAIGIAFGVVTLCFNRIGNFSIYPTPRRHTTVVTGGPYRWIRHPMYVALMLMMVGIAGYNGTWRNALGAMLVIVVVVTKAAIEESLMSAEFAEYAAYRRRSWRFIPLLY